MCVCVCVCVCVYSARVCVCVCECICVVLIYNVYTFVIPGGRRRFVCVCTCISIMYVRLSSQEAEVSGSVVPEPFDVRTEHGEEVGVEEGAQAKRTLKPSADSKGSSPTPTGKRNLQSLRPSLHAHTSLTSCYSSRHHVVMLSFFLDFGDNFSDFGEIYVVDLCPLLGWRQPNDYNN